jgi:ABC-2 type transport system ATP-binding protein
MLRIAAAACYGRRVIVLDDLSKAYGHLRALDGVHLEVPRGAMCALLGHNGAGKTTVFGCVLGHLRPSGGDARIDGVSVARDRARALSRVGAVLDPPAFYDYLTGAENLALLASYSGGIPNARLRAVGQFVGIAEHLDRRVATYSRGMRQRLGLAQALLPEPDVLLLDEPAEGLDPEGIDDLRRALVQLNRERGVTVLLASHLLSEVEQTCDRIAILRRGRLVLAGKLADLAADGRRARVVVDDWERAAPILRRCGALVRQPEVIDLGASTDLADLVTALVEAGVRVREARPLARTLGEIYRAHAHDADQRRASETP